MKFLVIGKWKNQDCLTIWSNYDNEEQANHSCQLIHNDSNVAYAFVTCQTNFTPSDDNKR